MIDFENSKFVKLIFKCTFTMAIFATPNHNYNHKQRTLKDLETQKHTERIEIHQSQITNLDLLNPLK